MQFSPWIRRPNPDVATRFNSHANVSFSIVARHGGVGTCLEINGPIVRATRARYSTAGKGYTPLYIRVPRVILPCSGTVISRRVDVTTLQYEIAAV